MSFDSLPDHLILDIFKNVCAADLPRIRLVCRKWAEVVSDSIALRRKHKLVVKCVLLNDSYPFVQTFLRSPYNVCASIDFDRVVIDEESEMVTRLWGKIGADIEGIRVLVMSNMEEAGFNFRTQKYKHNWMTLMRHTPNLIELKIDCLHCQSDTSLYSDEVIGEFDLKKLEKVKLRSFDSLLNAHIMKILIKSANKLPTIKFEQFFSDESDMLNLLIESKRHSLKELKLGRSGIKKEQWQKYLSIDNLSVENVSFDEGILFDTDLLELLGNLKNLRELTGYVLTGDNLQQYLAHLPRLQKLDLRIGFNTEEYYTSFYKNFGFHKPSKVRVKCDSNVTFETSSNSPKLEYLEIYNYQSAQISSVSLQNFIDNYPHLKVLRLYQYRCDSQYVAAICEKLVHLEDLQLRIQITDPAIDRNAFSNISKLSKLRRLSAIDFIHICDDTFFTEHLRLPALICLSLGLYDPVLEVTALGLFALIDNCPLLEDLYIPAFSRIADAELNHILEGLVHLQKLIFVKNRNYFEKSKDINNNWQIKRLNVNI